MASPAFDREAVNQAIARGSDLLKQGNLDEAQKAFRAALQLDAENPRVLALLGLTYFKSGQYEQARPIYEELVERAPTDPSHRLNLGLVYLKLGDSDKAIGALEASRALDPSQGRAVSYLGLAYARAGRYAEAYRSFILAGQMDLAHEVETNLTPAERESIQAQLARASAAAEPRTKPPKEPPKPVPPTSTKASPAPPPPPPAAADAEKKRLERERLEHEAAAQQEAERARQEASRLEVAAPPENAPQVSMPEIQIDRLGREDDAAETAEVALDEIEADDYTGAPAPPATEIGAPRMTESLQFVLPQRDAVPEPAEGQSMISRAVEIASPSKAASGTGSRVGWGSTPPVPLSQLATELLVRPEDGDEAFEVTAGGALVIRVSTRTLTRLDGIHVTGGDLEFGPAMRRSRGRESDEKFDFGGSRMHVVSGNGYLIAVPGKQKFTAVSLDDDIFYLREDLVFAFESTLRWENGNVPGLRGKLPVIQFRGDGAIALRTSEQLVRVKLPAQGVLYIDAMRLAGWIGRVIPRAVVPPTDGPMGDVCIECTGEGVVLIDPAASPVVTADRVKRATSPEGGKATPPPPPQPAPVGRDAPVELDAAKADWLVDDDQRGDKLDEI